MKSITIYDNEAYLRQISKLVDIKNDKDLENDIKILDEFCRTEPVMAMAAVQLGIPKRIVYLKNANLDIVNRYQNDSATEEERNYNIAKVLINPVIIRKEGLTEYWEACASCLDKTGLVYRPYKIEVEYYDEQANKYMETFESLEATCLCHEIDHLDGILHIDRAEEVISLKEEERKKLRQENPYKIYFKEGSYEELLLQKSKRLKR